MNVANDNPIKDTGEGNLIEFITAWEQAPFERRLLAYVYLEIVTHKQFAITLVLAVLTLVSLLTIIDVLPPLAAAPLFLLGGIVLGMLLLS